MQFRFSTLLPVAAIAAIAAAAPSEFIARGNSSECSTGTISCCNQTYDPQSAEVDCLFGILGLGNTGNLQGRVGVNCSPSGGVIEGGGTSCTQEPVCCNGNDFNGLIVIGCSPININL